MTMVEADRSIEKRAGDRRVAPAFAEGLTLIIATLFAIIAAVAQIAATIDDFTEPHAAAPPSALED